ncbi:hypothetical protein BSL78_15209 [Apostichopus japonicus]|uniref:Ig-like domain-containing protein n=1 Tax=Stichopus japonicus TaxID=307972 RepID=A0A2G8KIW2_STIJA|nr:hypothetical protein BSL78_15209 [Apostichopus japonicus]
MFTSAEFTEFTSHIPFGLSECSLVQYLEIGTMGIVQCSFNENYLAVAWYNVNEMKPILLYKDGVKTGDGFDSGEFDIYPNGSLVIRTVAIKYEAVYTVSKVITSLELPVSYDIRVQTTVTPTNTIPAVEQCSYVFDNICVKTTVRHIEVTCSTKESRPAIYLSWAKRTHGRDFILPSNYMNFTNSNVTYTSLATTKFFFEDSTFLTLLVCQASSVPLNLMKQENIILIERQIDYTSMHTPDKTYVKIHQRMYLLCNDRTLNLLMWKRSRGREDDVETMFVSIFQPSNLTQLTYKEYQLEVDGSISLQNTLLEHEGLYACLHDNGVSGGIKLHNVSVIVDPIPAFPVVDGCNHQQYCVLEKEPQDQLTCSVLGIRPEVSLEWRAFRQETPIVFTHNVLKVTKEGDGYDVSLTVNFDITLTVQEKITVECHVVGDNSEFFSLSTKVDLLFNNVRRRIKEREPNDVQENAKEEATPMMKVVNDDSQQRYDENKEELFIDQLKRKYEILYDAVQPIPYIKDRMYCVDKVFVEGGMEYLDKTTVAKQDRARLTGFDDLARDKYIRKAVTGDDDEAVDEIKRKLQENPVLGDLCEVPLFFVMFAHITHENKELQTFNSVTGFFRYMISCFHSHMWNKMKDENVTTFQLFEANHSKLDEIAFKALCGKDQSIVWKKHKICKALGEAFYNQYVRIGILVEEEVLDMFSMPDEMGNIRSTVEVRFYHKLFCEWYAAHHLAMKITKLLSITSAVLANLDPFDLQYVYRFACGLNKAAARNIIKYLQKNNEGQKFAMLCILEQEGDKDELLESVTELVSNIITINVNDSKLLQRSVTQILEFASKKEIPITSVCLNKSFKECEGDVIILHSGLRLTQLLTVEEIHIETEQVNMKPRILTEEDVTKIFRYGLRSEHVKNLSFADCALPLSFSLEALPKGMKSRDIKVLWQPLKHELRLDISKGTWKFGNPQDSLVFSVKDETSLSQLCSETVSLDSTGSKQLQMSNIVHLELAASRNIPISCVYLGDCSPRVDDSDQNLMLQSGLSLSILSSLQKLAISDIDRRLTNEVLAAILSYSSQCTSLNELR